MTIEVARRSFITGLISLVAAPAIVRAGSLMPVKQILWTDNELARYLDQRLDGKAGAFDAEAPFKRYAGYEPVEFDADKYRWKTIEEIREQSSALAKEQLGRLRGLSNG